jgi:hypothetical protein
MDRCPLVGDTNWQFGPPGLGARISSMGRRNVAISTTARKPESTLIGTAPRDQGLKRPAAYVYGVVRDSEIEGVPVGEWVQIVTDGVYFSAAGLESVENNTVVKIYTESDEVLTLSGAYAWHIEMRERRGCTIITLNGIHRSGQQRTKNFLTLEDGDHVRNEARLVGGELHFRGHHAEDMAIEEKRVEIMLDGVMEAEKLSSDVKSRFEREQSRRGGWYKWSPN